MTSKQLLGNRESHNSIPQEFQRFIVLDRGDRGLPGRNLGIRAMDKGLVEEKRFSKTDTQKSLEFAQLPDPRGRNASSEKDPLTLHDTPNGRSNTEAVDAALDDGLADSCRQYPPLSPLGPFLVVGHGPFYSS